MNMPCEPFAATRGEGPWDPQCHRAIARVLKWVASFANPLEDPIGAGVEVGTKAKPGTAPGKQSGGGVGAHRSQGPFTTLTDTSRPLPHLDPEFLLLTTPNPAPDGNLRI